MKEKKNPLSLANYLKKEKYRTSDLISTVYQMKIDIENFIFILHIATNQAKKMSHIFLQQP